MDPNTDWVAGKLGNALDFDGSNDFVDTNFTTHYAKTTISAWFELDSFGEGNLGRIMDKREAGAEAILMYVNDTLSAGTLVFGRAFSGGTGFWNAPHDTINPGVWSHVVVTYDESSTANDPVIYLNGVSQTVTEVGTPSGTPVTNADAYLFGSRGAADRSFDGLIDNMRLYNRTLSAAEVTALYNGGAGCQ